MPRFAASIILLAVTSWPPFAAGDDARAASPAAVERAADSVLQAVGRHDRAALAALATPDEPDPWLVADALLSRDRIEDAEAFAKAMPRPDVEALPAYVSTRRGRPDDPGARRALARWGDALVRNEPRAALDALAGAKPDLTSVTGVRLAFARGTVLRALGLTREGARAFRDAADAAEKIGWLAVAVAALDECGSASKERSDLTGALAAWVRSLAIEERRGRPTGVARALGNLGVVHDALGEYAKAVEYYERALPMFAAAGDHAGEASTLGNLGVVQYALGRHFRARGYHERARKMLEELGDRAGAARVLGNIGVVEAALGNYARALECHQRALETRKSLGDRAGVARVLGNIGAVQGSLANFPAALACHQQALGIYEDLHDRSGTAAALANVGNVYGSLGDYSRALDHETRALALSEELKDRAGMAWVLGTMGVAQFSLGRFAQAVECGERALKMQQDLGDNAGAALTQCSIGVAYSFLGKGELALASLERAVRGAEHLRANDILARALWQTAAHRLRTGSPERALPDAHAAVKLLETLLGGLGEEQGATAREQFAALFAVGAEAAARAGDEPEMAYFLESGRAGTLLEALGGRQALRWVDVPDALRVLEAEARAKEGVSRGAHARAVAGGNLPEVRAVAAAVDAAKERLRDVVERIQREAKKEASLWYPRAAPLEEIQASLAQEEALVLYGLGGEQARAIVITSGGARIVALGETAPIETACRALAANDPGSSADAALDRLRTLLLKALLHWRTGSSACSSHPRGPSPTSRSRRSRTGERCRTCRRGRRTVCSPKSA